MRINLMGKRWLLRIVPLKKNRGDCDPPEKPNKEIRIDSTLKGEEELEVVLHELLHASHWHLDEQHVTRCAADLANVLWRLGYRKNID